MTLERVSFSVVGALACSFASIALPNQASGQFVFGGEEMSRRDRPMRGDDMRGRSRDVMPGVGLGIEIGKGILQQQPPGHTPINDTKRDAPKKPKQASKPKDKPEKKNKDKDDDVPVAKTPEPSPVDTSALTCAHDPDSPYDDGVRGQIKGCCCCVEKLSMRFKGGTVVEAKKLTKTVEDPDLDPVEIERDVGAQFGHEFKVNISYRNKLMPPGKSGGQCVLRWFEKSDRPPASNVKAGVTAGEWSDIGLTVGKRYPGLFKNGTLHQWANRPNACPLLTTSVELTDKPAVFYGSNRTLEFDIIVESAPSCGCKHESLQLKAKQVLDRGPEAGSTEVHPDTKFYGPDGKPMKGDQVAEGTDRPLPKAQPAPPAADATPKK